jgi:hypothetical protein
MVLCLALVGFLADIMLILVGTLTMWLFSQVTSLLIFTGTLLILVGN